MTVEEVVEYVKKHTKWTDGTIPDTMTPESIYDLETACYLMWFSGLCAAIYECLNCGESLGFIDGFSSSKGVECPECHQKHALLINLFAGHLVKEEDLYQYFKDGGETHVWGIDNIKFKQNFLKYIKPK